MKKLSLLLCALFLSLGSVAQLLKVDEIDAYGKEYPVRTKSALVDINSRLILTPDFSSLVKPDPSNDRFTDYEFVKQMDRYTHLLELRDQLLNLIKLNQGDPTTFSKLFLAFETEVRKFPELMASLKDLFNQAPNGQRLTEALNNFNRNFHITASSGKTAPAKTSVTIKATFHSKGNAAVPVHVKNFDNISDREFWPVQTWKTEPTPTEEKAFANAAAASSNVISTSKDYLASEIDKVNISQLAKNVGNLQLSGGFGSDKALSSVKSDLKSTFDQLQKVTKEKLINTSGTELDRLLKDTYDGYGALKNLANDATGKAKQDILSVLVPIDNAVKSLSELNREVLMKSESLVKTQKDAVRDFIYYGLAEAPDKAFIDLSTLGPRQNFDKVTIEIEVQDSAENRVLISSPELIELFLVEVNFHATSNVAVIFANPFVSGKDKLQQQFQAAPAANFVFKWGSRTSRFLNQTQPGIGLSVATPDFDLNSTLDISVGVVGTIFKDILSLGISYNTAVDVPFWFFGLSLPIGLSLIKK